MSLLLFDQQRRVVPWRSWAEWHSVWRALYDANSTDETKQFAIARVHTWEVRGRVPKAVLATADLVNALHISTLSSSSARLTLGMAVVRMVNSLVDPWQRRHVAQSIQMLAATLHLPRMLVDLRHAATHTELPPLALLQAAAAVALRWLNDWYWLPQSDRAEHLGLVSADLAAAHRDQVVAAMQTRRSAADAAPPTLLLPRYLKPRAAAAIVAHIVPALVADNCLLPDALLVVASFDAVPDELLAIWRPLLLAWHRSVERSVTVALLYALAQRALVVANNSLRALLPTVADNALVSLAMAWITHILFDKDFDLVDVAVDRDDDASAAAESGGAGADDDDDGDASPSVLLSAYSGVMLAPIVSLCCASDGFWARALLKTLLTSAGALACPDGAKRARLLKLIALWEVGSGTAANLPSAAGVVEPMLGATDVGPSVEFVPTKSAADIEGASSNLRRLLAKKRDHQSARKAEPQRHELTVEAIADAVEQRRRERLRENAECVWQLCEPTTVPFGLLPNGMPSNLDLPPAANRASVMLRPVVPVPTVPFATSIHDNGDDDDDEDDDDDDSGNDDIDDDDHDDDDDDDDVSIPSPQATKRARIAIGVFDFSSPQK
jgi:hypothetical protein